MRTLAMDKEKLLHISSFKENETLPESRGCLQTFRDGDHSLAAVWLL